MDAEELSSLVQAAASGLIWSIAGAYGLDRADVDDVAQVTWLRLVEHLDDLRDPARVGAWLVTTTRRECVRRARAAGREAPADDSSFRTLESDSPSPESAVLQSEREVMVWRAFRQLGSDCQELLRVLILAQPALSYEEIAAAFGRPIGSIGPSRARCLQQLRRKLGSDVSTAP